MLSNKQVGALLKQALADPEATSLAKKRLALASGEDAVRVVRKIVPMIEPLAKTEGRYAWSASKRFAKYIALSEILVGVLKRTAPFEWEDLEALIALSEDMGTRRASLKRVLAQVEAFAKKSPLTKPQLAILRDLRKEFSSGWHGHKPVQKRLDRILSSARAGRGRARSR